jgi:hypothetical protein
MLAGFALAEAGAALSVSRSGQQHLPLGTMLFIAGNVV